MSYEEKFNIARAALINHCKNCIKNNWEVMFDMWLSSEADMAFGYAYIDKFKEQFSEYMNSDIESKLFFAGSNIVYAIMGFIAYKKNAKLNDILKFTENFLEYQLEDFNNWCDEIIMAMPDDEEDNPS